jgi:hypothetical protein
MMTAEYWTYIDHRRFDLSSNLIQETLQDRFADAIYLYKYSRVY